MSRDADPKTDPKLTRLYDKRTVERNIKKGLVTRKDYEKYLKTLDDVTEKGAYGAAEIREEPDDDTAEDEVDEPEAAEPATDNQPE
ncbi:MAG TPA: hypothetical protein VN962_26135 [Polyangia bacterium]|nr:hypothetical protein [Polyangia bacterium]